MNETLNLFFGIAALVTSTLLTAIGFPAQIYQNFKRKSTKGLSFLSTLFLFANLNAWFFYGFTKPQLDWIIVCANALGIVMLAVMLVQFAIYGRKSARPNAELATEQVEDCEEISCR